MGIKIIVEACDHYIKEVSHAFPPKQLFTNKKIKNRLFCAC